jgi:hypothetical protein
MSLDDEIDNNAELKEKLEELDQQQDLDIQRAYETGEIIDFSKKINGNDKSKKNKNDDKEQPKQDKETKKEKKREFKTYKYSENGKGDLNEAVLINGFPFFIKYNYVTNKVEIIDKIEETSRILKPPQSEEYPYVPYEFRSKDELDQYIERAKKITLDQLYAKCKIIFSKYIDQDEHIISLLTADSIWTYFQDLFPTTHYFEGIGTNDVGKSSIGYTVEFTAYRVVKGTSISGPNYYRLLGTMEPGQCIIIEDEGDSISQDADKVKILKSGYEFDGKVPKINMNSKDQSQKWYYSYCYKIILAEKSLSQLKAKGLVDRTFSGYCRPGKPRYPVKSVVSKNTNKNPKLVRLCNEFLDFRMLMLCYRLIHYRDLLSEIDTGLKNRDDELCKPLLQLFYGNDALKEIIKTLEFFVNQRRERKSNSLEAILYPIIKKFILTSSNDSDQQEKKAKKLVSIPYSMIWSHIINDGIEGSFDEKKKYQYETVSYGILYNNSLSTFIADKFGAKLDKKTHGSILTFDIEKLENFENVYGNQLVEDIKIEVKPITTEEKIDDDEEENEYDGYDDFDGFRERVKSENIDSKTKTKHNFMSKNNISLQENNKTPLPETSVPSLPSYPSSSVTNKSNKDKQFTDELEELKPSPFYEDALSIIKIEKDIQKRELIIHNVKNIETPNQYSYKRVCSLCSYRDDKWGIFRHPCKNFYNQKKK